MKNFLRKFSSSCFFICFVTTCFLSVAFVATAQNKNLKASSEHPSESVIQQLMKEAGNSNGNLATLTGKAVTISEKTGSPDANVYIAALNKLNNLDSEALRRLKGINYEVLHPMSILIAYTVKAQMVDFSDSLELETAFSLASDLNLPFMYKEQVAALSLPLPAYLVFALLMALAAFIFFKTSAFKGGVPWVIFTFFYFAGILSFASAKGGDYFLKQLIGLNDLNFEYWLVRLFFLSVIYFFFWMIPYAFLSRQIGKKRPVMSYEFYTSYFVGFSFIMLAVAVLSSLGGKLIFISAALFLAILLVHSLLYKKNASQPYAISPVSTPKRGVQVFSKAKTASAAGRERMSPREFDSSFEDLMRKSEYKSALVLAQSFLLNDSSHSNFSLVYKIASFYLLMDKVSYARELWNKYSAKSNMNEKAAKLRGSLFEISLKAACGNFKGYELLLADLDLNAVSLSPFEKWSLKMSEGYSKYAKKQFAEAYNAFFAASKLPGVLPLEQSKALTWAAEAVSKTDPSLLASLFNQVSKIKCGDYGLSHTFALRALTDEASANRESALNNIAESIVLTPDNLVSILIYSRLWAAARNSEKVIEASAKLDSMSFVKTIVAEMLV